jgi:hypothetical protein
MDICIICFKKPLQSFHTNHIAVNPENRNPQGFLNRRCRVPMPDYARDSLTLSTKDKKYCAQLTPQLVFPGMQNWPLQDILNGSMGRATDYI